MDNNSPIGILDSGVGGLTAADCVSRLLPDESIVYFGDGANMPYGNKSREEIIRLANRMIYYLEGRGVKMILLACNTISSLKSSLSCGVPSIDIVSAGAAAVGQIAGAGETVGLIATKATVDCKAYDKAVGSLGKGITLISNASTSLPKIIDSQLENASLLDEKIRECIDPIVLSGRVTKLILGCSHFPIIREEISLIYPELELIDPAEMQAKMLKDYLSKEGKAALPGKREVKLYTSGPPTEFDATLRRLAIAPDDIESVVWED
ncbi:MAG: glutamate racemase [Eubacteriaceae bacterium]|nr:glutamate racemase [Eubacteriaceae bacterium]